MYNDTLKAKENEENQILLEQQKPKLDFLPLSQLNSPTGFNTIQFNAMKKTTQKKIVNKKTGEVKAMSQAPSVQNPDEKSLEDSFSAEEDEPQKKGKKGDLYEGNPRLYQSEKPSRNHQRGKSVGGALMKKNTKTSMEELVKNQKNPKEAKKSSKIE